MKETKWIVEKIFSLAYQGYGSAKITKILREEKVPTASWLNFTRYGTFAHIFEGKPNTAIVPIRLDTTHHNGYSA